jgi:predicted PurR-regulated permease PerM
MTLVQFFAAGGIFFYTAFSVVSWQENRSLKRIFAGGLFLCCLAMGITAAITALA